MQSSTDVLAASQIHGFGLVECRSRAACWGKCGAQFKFGKSAAHDDEVGKGCALSSWIFQVAIYRWLSVYNLRMSKFSCARYFASALTFSVLACVFSFDGGSVKLMWSKTVLNGLWRQLAHLADF